MTNLTDRCRACWSTFTQSLNPDDPRRNAKPDAFAFAGGGDLADELLALVLAGTKRATTSLPSEYTAVNDPLPKAGDLSIVRDSQGSPAAIIEVTAVDVVAFQDVDAAYAAVEGEGDGSLRHWREAHTWYFNAVCERLGGTFEPTTPVICQRFRLVWPPERAS